MSEACARQRGAIRGCASIALKCFSDIERRKIEAWFL